MATQTIKFVIYPIKLTNPIKQTTSNTNIQLTTPHTPCLKLLNSDITLFDVLIVLEFNVSFFSLIG